MVLATVRCEGRLVELPLPNVKTTTEIASGLATVIHAVGAGMLTPGEAEIISRILESHGRLTEAAEREQGEGEVLPRYLR